MVLQVIICVPESETGSQQSPSGEHNDEYYPAQESLPEGLAPIIGARTDRAKHNSGTSEETQACFFVDPDGETFIDHDPRSDGLGKGVRPALPWEAPNDFFDCKRNVKKASDRRVNDGEMKSEETFWYSLAFHDGKKHDLALVEMEQCNHICDFLRDQQVTLKVVYENRWLWSGDLDRPEEPALANRYQMVEVPKVRSDYCAVKEMDQGRQGEEQISLRWWKIVEPDKPVATLQLDTIMVRAQSAVAEIWAGTKDLLPLSAKDRKLEKGGKHLNIKSIGLMKKRHDDLVLGPGKNIKKTSSSVKKTCTASPVGEIITRTRRKRLRRKQEVPLWLLGTQATQAVEADQTAFDQQQEANNETFDIPSVQPEVPADGNDLKSRLSNDDADSNWSQNEEETEDSCDDRAGAAGNLKGVGVPNAWQGRRRMAKWNSMEPWEQEVEREMQEFEEKWSCVPEKMEPRPGREQGNFMSKMKAILQKQQEGKEEESDAENGDYLETLSEASSYFSDDNDCLTIGVANPKTAKRRSTPSRKGAEAQGGNRSYMSKRRSRRTVCSESDTDVLYDGKAPRTQLGRKTSKVKKNNNNASCRRQRTEAASALKRKAESQDPSAEQGYRGATARGGSNGTKFSMPAIGWWLARTNRPSRCVCGHQIRSDEFRLIRDVRSRMSILAASDPPGTNTWSWRYIHIKESCLRLAMEERDTWPENIVPTVPELCVNVRPLPAACNESEQGRLEAITAAKESAAVTLKAVAKEIKRKRDLDRKAAIEQ